MMSSGVPVRKPPACGVLDARAVWRWRPAWVAHRCDLLVAQRAYQPQLAGHLHILLVVFRRLPHAVLAALGRRGRPTDMPVVPVADVEAALATRWWHLR